MSVLDRQCDCLQHVIICNTRKLLQVVAMFSLKQASTRWPPKWKYTFNNLCSRFIIIQLIIIQYQKFLRIGTQRTSKFCKLRISIYNSSKYLNKTPLPHFSFLPLSSVRRVWCVPHQSPRTACYYSNTGDRGGKIIERQRWRERKFMREWEGWLFVYQTDRSVCLPLL